MIILYTYSEKERQENRRNTIKLKTDYIYMRVKMRKQTNKQTNKQNTIKYNQTEDWLQPKIEAQL